MTDERTNNLDIFGARLRGSDGARVSGPFRISTSDKAESVPDVSFDGTNFLVVWELLFGTSSDWDVRGQRVSKFGGAGLLGGNFTVDSAGANSREVAVAALPGSGWLVVWEDNRFSGDPLAIVGRWVTKDGAVNLNIPPLRLTTNAKRDDDADVTWNGSNFLVAWTHYFDTEPPADIDILAQRVGPGPSIFLSGTNFPISQPAGVQATPALASDGSRSLAVWTDNRGGPFQTFGSLVDSAAGVTANFPISNQARNFGAEAVAFYNGAYLVTWINEKTAGSNTFNINGARVTTDGGVRDANGFLVASDTNFFNRPALTRGVDGEWGIAYSFFNHPDQAVRLRRIDNTK